VPFTRGWVGQGSVLSFVLGGWVLSLVAAPAAWALRVPAAHCILGLIENPVPYLSDGLGVLVADSDLHVPLGLDLALRDRGFTILAAPSRDDVDALASAGLLRGAFVVDTFGGG
jgi:hypothetical protein